MKCLFHLCLWWGGRAGDSMGVWVSMVMENVFLWVTATKFESPVEILAHIPQKTYTRFFMRACSKCQKDSPNIHWYWRLKWMSNLWHRHMMKYYEHRQKLFNHTQPLGWTWKQEAIEYHTHYALFTKFKDNTKKSMKTTQSTDPEARLSGFKS